MRPLKRRGLVMQESVEAGHRHPVLTLLSLLALLHQRQVAGEGVQDYLRQAGVRATVAPDR